MTPSVRVVPVSVARRSRGRCRLGCSDDSVVHDERVVGNRVDAERLLRCAAADDGQVRLPVGEVDRLLCASVGVEYLQVTVSDHDEVPLGHVTVDRVHVSVGPVCRRDLCEVLEGRPLAQPVMDGAVHVDLSLRLRRLAQRGVLLRHPVEQRRDVSRDEGVSHDYLRIGLR